MELSDAMRTCAAHRAFAEDTVPDAVVHSVLDDARFAPSGGNRQPWRVVVVKDPSLKEKIARAYELGWREYMAFVRAGLVPFAPGPDGAQAASPVDLRAARLEPVDDDFSQVVATAPVLLLVVCHLPSLAVTDNDLGRQSIVGGASIYPFCHNVLLAARSRGLGGVMTTVLCRSEERVNELLAVPPGYGLAGLVVLGWPRRQPTRLRRRLVEEFSTVDSFEGRSFSLENPSQG